MKKRQRANSEERKAYLDACEYLNIDPELPLGELFKLARAKYKRLVLTHHPDKGGTVELMEKLGYVLDVIKAWDERKDGEDDDESDDCSKEEGEDHADEDEDVEWDNEEEDMDEENAGMDDQGESA